MRMHILTTSLLILSLLIIPTITQQIVSSPALISTNNMLKTLYEPAFASVQETVELWKDVELGDNGTNDYYFNDFLGRTYHTGRIYWRWMIDVIPENSPFYDLYAVYVYVKFVPGESIEGNGDTWVYGEVEIDLKNKLQQLDNYEPGLTEETAIWATQVSSVNSGGLFIEFRSYSVKGAPITCIWRDHGPGGFIKWRMVAIADSVKTHGHEYWFTILVMTAPHEESSLGNINLDIHVHSKWHHGLWDNPEYNTRIAHVISDTGLAYGEGEYPYNVGKFPGVAVPGWGICEDVSKPRITVMIPQSSQAKQTINRPYPRSGLDTNIPQIFL